MWLEDVLRLHPSSSTRVGRLKNFEPHHVVALQDPLYADDPTFFTTAGEVAAVALNFAKLGVQTPADDGIVVIVDNATISLPVADRVDVFVVLGGQILLALTTDTNVYKANRREQSRTTAVEKTGLSRIADNTNAFIGTLIGTQRLAANTPVTIPIGFRLYGSEQLWVSGATANQAITATMRGRVLTKGQR